MRLAVRVQPGARATRVGGRYGTAEPPVLVVRVAAPAVDGRANRALLAALAEAFGARRDEVRIVAGGGGRVKLVEIDGLDGGTGGDGAARLAELLAATR